MLWAEATLAYRNNEPWHLQTRRAIEQATQQQRDRVIGDTWDDTLYEFTVEQAHKPGILSERWTIGELFRAAFPREHLELDQRPQVEQKRFANALRRAGWASRKMRGLMRWNLTPERTHESGECPGVGHSPREGSDTPHEGVLTRLLKNSAADKQHTLH